MSVKIKLTYFNAMARAELIRLTLAAGEIPYEDNRITFEEWPKLKPSTTFGSLPLLEYGDVSLGQSISIARFVAKKAGLAGRNELEQVQADMVVDHYVDILNKMLSLNFAKGEERKTSGQNFFETLVPNFLKTSEALLKKNGGQYFVNGNLTYADIAVAYFLFLINHIDFNDVPGQEIRANISKDYPALSELKNRVLDVPGISRWVKARPQTPL